MIYDQFERFYGPVIRKGTEEIRTSGNAVCGFAEERANKAIFMEELFNAHKGIETKLSPVFQDKAPISGQHIHFVRQIETLTKEISDIDKEISAAPAQKKTWEKEIEDKTKGLQHRLISLQNNEVQKKNFEYSLKELEKKVDLVTLQIKEGEESIDKMTQDEKKEEKDLDDLKKRINEIENPQNKEEQKNEVQDVKTSKKAVPEDVEILKSRVESLGKQISNLKGSNKLKKDGRDKEVGNLKEEVQKLAADKVKKEQCRTEAIQNEKEYTQNIEDLKKGIEKLSEAIKAQEEKTKTLTKNLKEKKEHQVLLQEEADAYALLKYLSYANIYAAIPNDDSDYHGYKEQELQFSTLSNSTSRVVLESLKAPIKKAVNQELDKKNTEKNKKIKKLLIDESENIIQSVQIYINSNCRSDGYEGTTVKAISSIKERVNAFLSFENNWEKKLATPETKEEAPFSINMSQEEFQKENKAKLESLRADKLIKKTMDKWEAKISRGEGSLISQLGLKAALFNEGFDLKTHPYILSLGELSNELKPEGVKLAYQVKLNPEVWSMGLSQLGINYSQGLLKDAKSPLHGRISPVNAFVEKKTLEKEPNLNKVGFEKKIEQTKEGSKEHESLIRKAFLKGISYMNMFYALRHDEKGDATPELKSFDPVFAKYIKVEEFPKEARIDYMMAAKTLKWMKRVHDYGHDFIEKYGLKAHVFTIDVFPKPVNEKKENVNNNS